MTEEPVTAVKAPESPSATCEHGWKPEIIESLQALATVGNALRQNSIDDYRVAVLAEQIESLRSTADELDRQYAINVRGRKIKFKDRVAYLAVRERVASKIVDFAESLCQLRSTDAPTDAPAGESEGALSWDPDHDLPPGFLESLE